MAAAKQSKLQFSQKTVTIKKGNTHTASIIWMHGLGDTAQGWSDAMEGITNRFPHIQSILPTAPSMPITFQGGMRTTAWHDIEDIQNLTQNEFKYKEDTRKLINALIDEEVKNKGIDPSRIILGGFSQGAAMAIYCGLQYGHRLGGIVALSGYLCDMELVKMKFKKEIKSTPIVMYHGKNDMIVQTQYGRMSAMLLKTNGFNDMVWEEFDIPMSMNFGHNVVQAELMKVVQFVANRLPKEQDKGKQKKGKESKSEEKEDSNDKQKQIGPDLD